MTAADSPRLKDRTRIAIWGVLAAACVVGFLSAMAIVIVSPLALVRVFASGGDYSRAGDIGQAYGAASAIVATIALGVVAAGMVMQHRQHVADRLGALGDVTESLVRMAMDEPAYRQCWGGRVAPQDIDEGLFFYCNSVLKQWKDAWNLRDLSEEQARAYLANWFDAEINRLFWAMHGSWHQSVRPRTRRQKFLAIVNEEYLLALKSGAPSRPLEHRQPAENTTKPPRRSALDADQLAGRVLS